MKRVVLIGDSIRMGYEGVVRSELADAAFVWAPSDNGQHTVHVLLNLWTWVIAQQPDVVHVNAGLWDARRIVRDAPDTVVPLEAYQANVARIVALTRRHTGARVIWATTTPINAAAANRTHAEKGLAGRDPADIAQYNRVAVAAALREGAAINDLHQRVGDAGPDALLSADGVHFTPEGYTRLGQAVAAAIRPHL